MSGVSTMDSARVAERDVQGGGRLARWCLVLAAALWLGLAGCGDAREAVDSDVSDAGGTGGLPGLPDVGVSNDGGAAPDSATPDASAWVPGGPPRLVQLLDEAPLTAFAAVSEPLTFEVPVGARAVSIQIETDAWSVVTLTHWTQEGGDALVRENWIDNDRGAPGRCNTCINPFIGNEQALVVFAPNNEVPRVVPGTHSIGVRMTARGGLYQTPSVTRLRVSVWALMGDAIPATATLDVHLRMATVHEWIPVTWVADSLNPAIGRVRELLAQAGVTLGEVTFSELPDEWAVVDYGFIEGNELARLFDEPIAAEALHIFLVDEIRLPGRRGGTILGISNGIPGPFAQPGYRPAGIGVALVPHLIRVGELNTEELAATIGHEIGHYLGLFHVTEYDDPYDYFYAPPVDPIADTVYPYENYLMHPGAAGRTISPTQSQVMRTGPTVRWP